MIPKAVCFHASAQSLRAEFGSGDKRVQAYCFRSCYTNVPENRIPFPKPDGYDASQYEILLRVLNTGWGEFFEKFDPIRISKRTRTTTARSASTTSA